MGAPEPTVSHLAAAYLWQMAVDEPTVVHLTVPRGCAPRISGALAAALPPRHPARPAQHD
ncbi:MAG TPA: hypothetical protein VFQ77_11975 [Pseudonocardiaceae bacterium]|nr:hypothetical protein [Pseudonocardiaceae bacterium]